MILSDNNCVELVFWTHPEEGYKPELLTVVSTECGLLFHQLHWRRQTGRNLSSGDGSPPADSSGCAVPPWGTALAAARGLSHEAEPVAMLVRGLSRLVIRGWQCVLQRPGLPDMVRHQRFLHCTCCNDCCSAPVDLHQLDYSPPDPEADDIDERYTPQQRAAVLRVLNTASREELAGIKLLRGRKSANIVEYRDGNGPFTHLRGLLEVPLFKHKTIMKVCQSILNPCQEPGRRDKKLQGLKFIKPDVERRRLLAAKSIVSIVFGIRKIAWAHVDRNLTVLDWNRETSHRYMKGPYLPSIYLEEISLAVAKIPKADFFILEKPGISTQNTHLFPVTLHLRTIEAMLHGLLGGNFMEDGQHRVLSVVRTAVGKHFELMVGESRTSGRELVQQLMVDSVTQEHPRVLFPRDTLARYRRLFQKGNADRGEEMCDALLQAVAFYEFLFNNS
ncbi:transcription elongation factor, mitochondrial [Heterodontus francisci]|uniref:transcription elongation factor, mitochondrial n=1 Tax=Heterodontus francisci TaxID=7792 RepID=UPI00355B0A64